MADEAEIRTVQTEYGKLNYRHNDIDISAVNDIKYRDFKVYENDIILDVGAGIGVFAIMAAQICKQVIAYESNNKSFRLLASNVSLNELGVKFILRNDLLVGNDDETRIIDKRSKDKIHCENIDDIYKLYKFNKIRMNYDGMEYELIKGFSWFDKIDEILINYNFKKLKDHPKNKKYFEVIDILHSYFPIVKHKSTIGDEDNIIIHAYKCEDVCNTQV